MFCFPARPSLNRHNCLGCCFTAAPACCCQVRDAFALAKEKQPAIIFIDEIDAIGTKRFDSELSGDREVQRTMLELLNQLDGFTSNDNVKVMMRPWLGLVCMWRDMDPGTQFVARGLAVRCLYMLAARSLGMGLLLISCVLKTCGAYVSGYMGCFWRHSTVAGSPLH